MIKFLHIRQIDEKNNILPQGGMTIAYTKTLDEVMFNVARCHLEYDNYCRRVGREIAVNRMRKFGPEDVIPLTHPVTEGLVNWISNSYFDVPIEIKRLGKHWVSNFGRSFYDALARIGNTSVKETD